MRTLWARIRGLSLGHRFDRRLDDEVQSHLEQLADDYQRRGMTAEQARLAARQAFGGVEQMKETYRDRRGIPLVETLTQDARYALRALGQHPGFTAVALLSLALGIGATTAVFSVMNAAMLRPLVGRDVGDLVVLAPERNNERFLLFNPEFEALRVRQRSLSNMFAVSEQPFLRVEFRQQPPSYVAASLVSGTYFDVLGIAPAAGRLLAAADDEAPNAGDATACVAVISDALWNRWFERTREAIGTLIRLRDRDCAIIGVAPAGFVGHQARRAPPGGPGCRPVAADAAADRTPSAGESDNGVVLGRDGPSEPRCHEGPGGNRADRAVQTHPITGTAAAADHAATTEAIRAEPARARRGSRAGRPPSSIW